MTTATEVLSTGAQPAEPDRITADRTVRLVRPRTKTAGTDGAAFIVRPVADCQTGTGGQNHSPAGPAHGRTIRSWPLLILALPAAVAVWSGWIGIGQLTGFGQVRPLPGIWDSLHLDTAVTLPVGVEAYAAYALRAWLTASTAVSGRTRRFARRSAIGSLVLGMAGQAGYHLLTQAHIARAPWAVTTAVSCMPVLVLGMGTALAHLLHADAHGAGLPVDTGTRSPELAAHRADHRSATPDHPAAAARARRLADAEETAARLTATGQRVSRRTLRTAGLHGSNADLGTLARIITSPPTVRPG